MVKTDPYVTFEMIRDLLRKKYNREPQVSEKGKFKLKMRVAEDLHETQQQQSDKQESMVFQKELIFAVRLMSGEDGQEVVQSP